MTIHTDLNYGCNGVAAVSSQDPFENEKSSSQRVYPNE